MAKTFTKDDVVKIAELAHIPLANTEVQALAHGFTKTMTVVDTLTAVDVTNVEPVHHVTGLENVFRDDEVEVGRMFSQEQALKNAKRSYKGFFVIEQIIDEK